MEGRFCVHVVDGSPLLGSQSKQQTDGFHASHRLKDFIKVNAGLLHEAACNQLCFVLDHLTSYIFLQFVDPFEAYWSMPMW